jgi:hypothetical protein
MRQIIVSTLAVIAIVISACESTTVVESDQTQNLTSFEYKGGLNTTFDVSSPNFQGKGRITQLSSTTFRLDIQINVRSASINQNEQGNISFQFQFESEDGNLTEGNYIIDAKEPGNLLSQGDYKLTEGTNSFSRYNFYGSKLSLKIESNKSSRLRGTFMLTLEQRIGERMFNGQLETVQLVSPIVAAGYFDLEVENTN